MNKRLGASIVAGSALAAGLVATAPAANAAVCGSYPPGQKFQLNRVPFSGEVAKGSVVGTRGTLRRGGQACSGFVVGFYVAKAGDPAYRLRARGTTSSSGSVRATVVVDRSTRFYYNLNLGNGQSVRSGITQLKAV